MSQQQGRVTNSLVDVIRTIQAERRSGELQVGRGNPPYTEIGSITFMNGQIVAARLGAYQGPQALAILNTWTQCVFIFNSSTSPLPQSQRGPDTGPIRTPLSASNSGIYALPENASEIHSGPLLSLTTIPSATMSVVKAIRVIEGNRLPRSYRQLIFLIDGRRSVEELIVALGIEPGEVSQMLHTLHQLQIIRLTR